MRNATSSISTSQQLLTSAVDFNRAKSSESTENAMGPTSKGGRHHHNHNNHHSSSSMSVASSSGASFASAEGRGVIPIFRKNQDQDSSSSPLSTFLRTRPSSSCSSSWRNEKVSSAFCYSSALPTTLSSSSSSSIAREEEMDDVGGFFYYTIQRCSAFDEDDYSDSDY